jgi:hypothetical protein
MLDVLPPQQTSVEREAVDARGSRDEVEPFPMEQEPSHTRDRIPPLQLSGVGGQGDHPFAIGGGEQAVLKQDRRRIGVEIVLVGAFLEVGRPVDLPRRWRSMLMIRPSESP